MQTSQSSKLSYEFDARSRALLLEADIEAGWTFHRKVYCFSETKLLDSLRDQRLRFRLSVFPRPDGWPDSWLVGEAWDRWTSRVPILEETSIDWADLSLEVSGNVCKLRVPIFTADGSFNSRLPWREGRFGKPTLHWQYRFLNLAPVSPDDKDIAGAERVLRIIRSRSGEVRERAFVSYPPFKCEFQFLLIVQPPTRKPDPTYWDWERRFFPGGLPSLGKRRP